MDGPRPFAIRLFALTSHGDQLDKSGAPYFDHAMRVALSFKTEPEITVGLLHDVVEDCGITLEYLRLMWYPPEVVEAIDSLTKRPEEADNYEAYIQRVVAGPLLARRVKLADLKDNLAPWRCPAETEDDLKRIAKHQAALKVIEASLNESSSEETSRESL